MRPLRLMTLRKGAVGVAALLVVVMVVHLRASGDVWESVTGPFRADELTAAPLHHACTAASVYQYRGGDLRNASFEPKFGFSRVVWWAVRSARRIVRSNSSAAASRRIIPLIITPLMLDVEMFTRMLRSINVPVLHFYFVWNGRDDAAAGEVVDELRRIPFGVVVWHQPTNLGFAASVNRGLRFGLNKCSAEQCPWFFIINSDVKFPNTTLPLFVKGVHRAITQGGKRAGMIYGPSIDHYAFAVTRCAVEAAGLLDENFYPAYFEDVDWRWRFLLAGFEDVILGLSVEHVKNFNIKKQRKLLSDPCAAARATKEAQLYLSMRRRGNSGWSYGQMKWGPLLHSQIHSDYPPSGYKAPFNISGFPLHLWVVDPAFISCIKTGHGPKHLGSGKCWYNGAATLAPYLPRQTSFPEHMRSPTALPYPAI